MTWTRLSLLSLILLSINLLSGCQLTKQHGDAKTVERDRPSPAVEPRKVEPKAVGNRLEPAAKPPAAEPATDVFVAAEVKGAGYQLQRFYRGEQYLDKVILTQDIAFDFDNSSLRPAARKIIDSVTQQFLSQLQSQYIYVVGHTDSDGDEGYNIGLSLRRAASVVSTFSKYGINHNNVFVIPAGEHMPLVANNSPSNKAKNRRVEIYISPWRDLAQEYIRQWKCPEAICSYAKVSILPVTRNFQLSPRSATQAVERTIVPMQTEYESRNFSIGKPTRNLPSFPIVVREVKMPIIIRDFRSLGKEYQAEPDNETKKKLQQIKWM